MAKISSLSERLEAIFEEILKGNITDQMIAEVFSHLRLKKRNYNDIKNALLRAGDIEPNIQTDVYTRKEIMSIFNWEERTLQENLKKWNMPHSSRIKIYEREKIHTKAKEAGWRYDEENGWWIKPRPTKKQ